MIRIGSFARLAQVSIVTLRHYDDIGLLEPLRIDPSNGYRFYGGAQLHQLNRILALKELGLSLEDIKRLLAEGLDTEQLHSMLKLKQIEEEQHLQVAQERLKRIELRLRQLEMEKKMSHFDVIIKNLPSQLVASQRLLIPNNDEVPDYLGPAFDNVAQHLEKHKLKATDPCFTLWHSSADTCSNEDVEVVFPIEQAIDASKEIQIYTLPSALVASTVHQGKFDDFTQAHSAILAWIEENGYEVCGPYREIYIAHDPAGESTTEVQFEVKKAKG